MKTSNKILVGTYLALVIIAMGFLGFMKSNAVEYTPITSEGELETINYNLSHLKTLEVSVGNITLINGDPRVEIICGENIKKMIDAGFEDGNFYVHTNQDINNELHFDIKVYSNDLESVLLLNRATIGSEGQFQAGTLQINMHNFAMTDHLNVDADSLNIFSTNASEAWSLGGNVDVLNIKTYNSAQIHANNIIANSAIVHSSNNSFVAVKASEYLYLNPSNSAHIRHHGDPKKLEFELSNSGRISKYEN